MRWLVKLILFAAICAIGLTLLWRTSKPGNFEITFRNHKSIGQGTKNSEHALFSPSEKKILGFRIETKPSAQEYVRSGRERRAVKHTTKQTTPRSKTTKPKTNSRPATTKPSRATSVKKPAHKPRASNHRAAKPLAKTTPRPRLANGRFAKKASGSGAAKSSKPVSKSSPAAKKGSSTPQSRNPKTTPRPRLANGRFAKKASGSGAAKSSKSVSKSSPAAKKGSLTPQSRNPKTTTTTTAKKEPSKTTKAPLQLKPSLTKKLPQTEASPFGSKFSPTTVPKQRSAAVSKLTRKPNRSEPIRIKPTSTPRSSTWKFIPKNTNTKINPLQTTTASDKISAKKVDTKNLAPKTDKIRLGNSPARQTIAKPKTLGKFNLNGNSRTLKKTDAPMPTQETLSSRSSIVTGKSSLKNNPKKSVTESGKEKDFKNKPVTASGKDKSIEKKPVTEAGKRKNGGNIGEVSGVTKNLKDGGGKEGSKPVKKEESDKGVRCRRDVTACAPPGQVPDDDNVANKEGDKVVRQAAIKAAEKAKNDAEIEKNRTKGKGSGKIFAAQSSYKNDEKSRTGPPAPKSITQKTKIEQGGKEIKVKYNQAEVKVDGKTYTKVERVEADLVYAGKQKTNPAQSIREKIGTADGSPNHGYQAGHIIPARLLGPNNKSWNFFPVNPKFNSYWSSNVEVPLANYLQAEGNKDKPLKVTFNFDYPKGKATNVPSGLWFTVAPEPNPAKPISGYYDNPGPEKPPKPVQKKNETPRAA